MKIDENNLTELLKDFLLERSYEENPKDNLTDELAEQVFNTEYDSVPSEKQKRELLKKLRKVAEPVPGPAPKPFWETGSLLVLMGTVLLVGIIALVTLPKLIPDSRESSALSSDSQPSEVIKNDSQEGEIASKPLESNSSEGLPLDETSEFTESQVDSIIESEIDKIKNKNTDSLIKVAKDLNSNVSALQTLLTSLSPSGQQFVFNSGNDTTVMAMEGTLIYFSPNSFVDSNGKEIKGKVRVEIEELYHPKNWVFSDIETRYKNGQIATPGGINIRIFQGKKELFLKKTHPLYVEFARNKQYAGPESQILFTSKNNGKNWQLNKKGKTTELTPIPLMSLNYSQFKGPQKETKWNELISLIQQHKNEGTYLATRQFLERLIKARKFNFNTDIIYPYVINTRKPIWESDFRAVDLLKGNPAFQGQKYYEECLYAFEQFSTERWEKVGDYETFGVNPSQKNALSLLEKRGVSTKTAVKTIRSRSLQRIFSREISKNLRKSPIGKSSDPNSYSLRPTGRTRGFLINRSGLILPGNTMFPQKGTACKLIVKVAKNHLENARVFLVIPKTTTTLKANLDENNEAIFENIPRNLNARIVVIGKGSNNILLGQKSIQTNGDATYTIHLQQTEKMALKKQSVEWNM